MVGWLWPEMADIECPHGGVPQIGHPISAISGRFVHATIYARRFSELPTGREFEVLPTTDLWYSHHEGVGNTSNSQPFSPEKNLQRAQNHVRPEKANQP
jgi:hypothetical protein